MNKITIGDLKFCNEQYFKKGNKRFFGDISYRIKSKKGRYFLVTETAGFSDMFGSNRKHAFFTIKEITENTVREEGHDSYYPNNSRKYLIGNMIERNEYNYEFRDLEEVNEFLKDYVKVQ